MIRKAMIRDAKPIHGVISEQAEFGHILPRAMSEIYAQIRAFSVYTTEETEEIVGCGALEIMWEDLAEIRSVAVLSNSQNLGIGTRLIEALLEEARQMGVKRVFVLTYRPNLFKRLGFDEIEKNELPHKIWADCIRCTKFPECDEIALARYS